MTPERVEVDREPAGPEYRFDFPAPPRPPWLDRLALLLLVPLLAGGGNPVVVIMLAVSFSRRVFWLEPWMAASMGVACVSVPVMGALVLLFHRASSYRRVVVEEARGFVFGITEKWRGTRVPWEQVQAFRITGQGLMLKLKQKPWTRFLGPIVHCSDRDIHDLVVLLEERGIYRLGADE